MAGVYANFANVTFSAYEFTLTFARVDHEMEEGDIPGVVVSRVNMSQQFFQELLAAMQDSYSKWSTQEGIRNLRETPPRDYWPSTPPPARSGRATSDGRRAARAPTRAVRGPGGSCARTGGTARGQPRDRASRSAPPSPPRPRSAA